MEVCDKLYPQTALLLPTEIPTPIELRTLNLCTGWKCVINFTLRPPYPCRLRSRHQLHGRADQHEVKKSWCCRKWNPGHHYSGWAVSRYSPIAICLHETLFRRNHIIHSQIWKRGRNPGKTRINIWDSTRRLQIASTVHTVTKMGGYRYFFLWIPFYLQAVQIHSANGVKLLEAWRGVLSSTPPYYSSSAFHWIASKHHTSD
jgi:hypothetical protein